MHRRALAAAVLAPAAAGVVVAEPPVPAVAARWATTAAATRCRILSHTPAQRLSVFCSPSKGQRRGAAVAAERRKQLNPSVGGAAPSRPERCCGCSPRARHTVSG